MQSNTNVEVNSIHSDTLTLGAGAVLTISPIISVVAIRTWDGGSTANNLWTTKENWVGDVAPLPGDNLVFPTGTKQLENVNDSPSTTVFGSITVSDSGYHFQTNDSSSTSVQVQAGTQLEVDKIVSDTLTLGAGATLTISPIAGGPLAANSPLTPLATNALLPNQPINITQPTVANTVAPSSSTDTTTLAAEPLADSTVLATPIPATSEAATMAESSSSLSNTVLDTVAMPIPIVADISLPVRLQASSEVASSLASSNSLSNTILDTVAVPTAIVADIALPVGLVESTPARLIDTAINRLPSQSPIYSWIDPTALPKIIVGGLEQSITTRNGNITSTPILASLRDELPSHVEKSDKHLTTPAISSRQAHIAALQTVVQNSRWTDTDAEVDFDMAQHIRAVKHSKQLEKAVDDVLAEEDAVLVEL